MPRFLLLIFLCFLNAGQGCQKQNAGDNRKQDSIKPQSTTDAIKKDTTKKTGNERIDNQDVSKETSPVEAKYTVGDTKCEIKRVVKVYWAVWQDGHKNILNLCYDSAELEKRVTWCEHSEK